MKTKPTRYSVLALVCAMSLVEPLLGAEAARSNFIDVALKEGGVLIGQVVDTYGQAMANTEVVLSSRGKQIARSKTAQGGWFQVEGLRGGSLEIAAAGTKGNCRVWAPGTAPPAAQQALLVVADEEVVRGQHMGRHVPGRQYNRGGVRGHGGGLLGLMIDHPLVTAGAVAAAIAVPLAVSNDDSPSTP